MLDRNYRVAIVLLGLGVMLGFVAPAFADTPAVASFTASSLTVADGYNVALQWNTNGNGEDLLATCPDGVTLKNAATGASFPCGQRTQVSTLSTDSLGLTINNLSGGSKTLTLTLYPKDQSGADYDAGASSLNLSVSTSPQPLTDFAVSSTTPSSGSSITLTWAGTDTPGANLVFDCVTGVELYLAGSLSPLPCSTLAFQSTQPTSGSVTVNATNNTQFPITVVAHVLPAIDSISYDATHELSTSFQVQGYTTPPTATAGNFTSSANLLYPGTPFTISWNTQNAASSNLEFTCGSAIEVSVASGTTTLPCGALAFATPLPPSGSMSFVAQNLSVSTQSLSVIILTGDSSGNYSSANTNTIYWTVEPRGISANPIATPPVSQPVGYTPSGGSSNSSSGAVSHAAFTTALYLGVQNSQVSMLQTFLAQNKTIYPTGLVTGYFGLLTQAAVERFQVHYGIATPSDAGYGFVGPKTRTKLNSLSTP